MILRSRPLQGLCSCQQGALDEVFQLCHTCHWWVHCMTLILDNLRSSCHLSFLMWKGSCIYESCTGNADEKSSTFSLSSTFWTSILCWPCLSFQDFPTDSLIISSESYLVLHFSIAGLQFGANAVGGAGGANQALLDSLSTPETCRLNRIID